MTLIHTSYPVFEADQVLSQKHLNKLMCYLEEQDRASRIHLTGMGILCGLDLSTPTANQIAISCGTGVTSLGYLIPFEGAVYTKFKETTLSDHFLNPDLTAHPYLEEVYAFAEAYQPLSPCLELLPADTEDEDQQNLTEEILDDKVVMLLIEIPLIDEKNCTTTDCADKGQRLEFNVRSLLIDPSQLEEFENLNELNARLQKVLFKRYNVPVTNITTGQDVLNGFKKLLENSTLLHLDDRVNDLFMTLSVFYGSDAIGSLSSLNNIRPALETVRNAHIDGIAVQYVWDWLCDVGQAYNEIVSLLCSEGFRSCCPRRDLFPFHLLLGSVNSVFSDFRTPWISAGNPNTNNDDDALQLLVSRLIAILEGYQMLSFSSQIRITPSRYGQDPLSQRAIPYYYKNIITLKDRWNPKLTATTMENTNLSYHAQVYAGGNESVEQPLLYAIEPYNFFRIEGHIGQNYQRVMQNLLASKRTHQLPFDIIALNAVDYEERELRLSQYEGDFGALELDYDLVRRDWENVIGKNIEWIEDNYREIEDSVGSRQNLNRFIRDLKRGRNAMIETLRPFLLNYYSFMEIYEDIEEMAVSFRERIFDRLNESKTPIFDEDLIDHLDAIIMVCQKGEFRQIFQTAREQWKEISAAGTFKKFAEKHPGLDHKAGVTKGGTLVIVYQDLSAYSRQSSFDKKNKKEIGVVAMSSNEVTATLALPTDSPTATMVGTAANFDLRDEKCDPDFGRNFLSYAASYLPAQNYGLVEAYFNDYYLRPRPEIDESKIPERVVIADFFLPYRCCGGKGGVHFILPEVETPPIVADFDGNDFDGSDFFTNDQ